MRLPPPFPHPPSPDPAPAPPTFATSRASSDNNPQARTDLAGQYLYSGPTVLAARPDHPPGRRTSRRTAPIGPGLPWPKRLSRPHARPVTWDEGRSKTSGAIARCTGAILGNAAIYARTGLATGTIGLLMLTTMACGTEETLEPTEQTQRTEQTNQRTPSERRELTSSQPEATNVATTSSQPNPAAPRTSSGSASGESATPTPTSRDATKPTPTEAALTPERAREAADHYDFAEYYLRQQRYHRALWRLDQAITSNPDLAEAYTLRGFARVALHDYAGGLEDLDHAIELKAGNAVRAQAFRSFAHSGLGDYDQAIADAKNAERAAQASEDDLSREDAGIALLTAYFRKGDLSAANGQGQYRAPFTATSKYNFGLRHLHADSGHGEQDLNTLREIDASLILRQDDAELHYRRGDAHRRLGWHAKAAEDYTKALELYGNDAPERLYTSLANSYLKMEQHEEVVQLLNQSDLQRNPRATALLAYAYLRLGKPEDAMRSIDAVNYGFDTLPTRRGLGREYWYQELGDNLWSLQWVYVPHLVLKGAIYAANGEYAEGAKYINIVECASTWWDTGSDAIPNDVRHDRENILSNYQAQSDYHRESIAESQQALSEWCDYPSELVADPEAAIWATALTAHLEDPFIYRGLASVQSLDPLVIETDEVGLLLYFSKRFGTESGLSMDVSSAIERVIELDPSIADAHRIKAELCLTTFPSVPQSLRNIRPQIMRQRYQQAVTAWETYETLAIPEPEVAANHHFARGKVLAELGRKEEAQAAYQKSFELGYDETAVRQALVELNR